MKEMASLGWHRMRVELARTFVTVTVLRLWFVFTDNMSLTSRNVMLRTPVSLLSSVSVKRGQMGNAETSFSYLVFSKTF